MVSSRVGRKRQILWLSGVVLASTTVALLWIGNYPIVIMLFLFQSAGWSFFPVAMTIPYELPGIKPRELAVASSILYTALWIGAFTGPVLAGAIDEVTGNLRLALMVTSLGPTFMILTGFLLSPKWDLAPGDLRPVTA